MHIIAQRRHMKNYVSMDLNSWWTDFLELVNVIFLCLHLRFSTMHCWSKIWNTKLGIAIYSLAIQINWPKKNSILLFASIVWGESKAYFVLLSSVGLFVKIKYFEFFYGLKGSSW